MTGPRRPDVPFFDCVWDQQPMDLERAVPDAAAVPGRFRVDVRRVEHLPVFGVHRLFREMDLTTVSRSARSSDPDSIVWTDDSGDRWVVVRSDDPQEICSCWAAARRAHGNVLVVGAGAGVAQQLMRHNLDVRTVTTVEESPDVAEAVGTVCNGSVVVSGYVDFVRRCTQRFDTVFLHPFNAYLYDLIPVLNAMAGEARSILVPGSGSRVWAWGYERMLDLYADAWVGMLEKLGRTPAVLRMNGDVLRVLDGGSPLTSACLRWFRANYPRRIPPVPELRFLARSLAMAAVQERA